MGKGVGGVHIAFAFSIPYSIHHTLPCVQDIRKYLNQSFDVRKISLAFGRDKHIAGGDGGGQA